MARPSPARSAEYLLFDTRRHERGEPPGHQLGPDGRVYDVERLQVLLVPATEQKHRLSHTGPVS